jgi:hypothetical protein
MINLSGNETKKAVEFEYENGHLVRINGMNDDIDDMEYDYNFDTLPYYEFVVEVDDTDADYFVIKNYYDENNLLTASEKGRSGRLTNTKTVCLPDGAKRTFITTIVTL